MVGHPILLSNPRHNMPSRWTRITTCNILHESSPSLKILRQVPSKASRLNSLSHLLPSSHPFITVRPPQSHVGCPSPSPASQPTANSGTDAVLVILPLLRLRALAHQTQHHPPPASKYHQFPITPWQHRQEPMVSRETWVRLQPTAKMTKELGDLHEKTRRTPGRLN